ncbi:recombinase family protein [Vibrio parahaemolyticus]|uniref:recombinase family protein n=1 Tax=Vibrio parahaemolyticus TaxID=670 RepID=UPI0004D4AD8D|nr:recombinase family protein [Vibrio parahaemolyticus]EJG0618783.1 recombinase family protein [Vibrio parahaemolyticus]EJG0638284.1 recombinase family protein [Vibrio parahaemolyticus]EJG0684199.1 recombinase family protein [Vibrio parahaemolyticus]EJG0697527.1 recombinase family protein [Vibrio parahaemolyticus]EJG0727934.1 recombinase family protein [Vibrio parahaemolyticus]
MADIAYIRVSTVGQNTERQLANCGIEFDKVYEDKASGSSTNRPELAKLMEYAREGDTIHIHSIDRLARSLDDLRKLVTNWNNDGITVCFHKEGLKFTVGENTPIAELMLNMLGAVAQFERSIIRERQAEGIAKAVKKGKYKGRQPDLARIAKIRELRENGVSVRKIAEDLGCNPSTVQRAIRG